MLGLACVAVAYKNIFCAGIFEPFSVQALYSLLEGRKAEKKEGSYTTYLFEKGIDKSYRCILHLLPLHCRQYSWLFEPSC